MSTRIASRVLGDNVSISRSSTYICRACRQTTHVTQQRRHASDEPPRPESFLEKTRSKLWKGQPPGPANIDDVYGGPGFFAERAKERKMRREVRIGSEGPVPASQVSEITEEESVFRKPAATQAQSIARSEQEIADEEDVDKIAPHKEGKLAADVRHWEDLEVIGHQGEWQEMPATKADRYTPWQKMDKELKWSKNELISLMAIAAEEGELVEQHYSPGDPNLPELAAAEKTNLLSQPLDFQPGSRALNLLTRFSYLVRRRIPDPILTRLSKQSAAPTVQDFLEMFDEKTKPRPTKIAEILMNNDKLGMHSNLLVFGRKEDMIDKETELGRWKVIEAELKDRGLPIPGQSKPQRNAARK